MSSTPAEENENMPKKIEDGADSQLVTNFSNDPKNNAQCVNSTKSNDSPSAKITHRYIVFIFICFLNFGSYFVYDNPSALEQPIKNTTVVTDEKYGVLYSVISWPNVILSFFGGYLIDRLLGIRWGSITFASVIALGQFVFAVGAYVNTFWVMIIGRFILGMGTESLDVAQNTYAVKWFKGKELNAVFGIQFSVARISSTINQFTMLPMYVAISKMYGEESSPKSLGNVLFIAFLICVMSVGCSFVLWYFDRKRDTYLNNNSQNYQTDCTKENVGQGDEKKPKEADSPIITPKDILRFPLTYWLICLVCLTFYCALLPFVTLGQLFFVNNFQMTAYEGSLCNGMIFFVAIPGSVISGLLIDYFGRNALFVIVSDLLILISHCLLTFTPLTPFVATAIMGFSYSLLAAALWPSIAYVVPDHSVATAYGVMESIQNFGLAIFYVVVGVIANNLGYMALELFYIGISFVALGLSLFLYYADYRRERYLIMDGTKRRKRLANLVKINSCVEKITESVVS